MVVGDDAQCLVAGTLVTMADGSSRAIEDVSVGEFVMSGLGGGSFGPARVTRVHRSSRAEGVAITLRSGRRLVSTPEHTHFAAHRVVPGSRARQSVQGSRAPQAAHNSPNRPPAHGLGDISAPEALMLPGRPRSGGPGELRTADDGGDAVRRRAPAGSAGHRLAVQRENGAGSDGLTGDCGGPGTSHDRQRAMTPTRLDPPVARLGPTRGAAVYAAALVAPGMLMFDEHGGYDVVESVERIDLTTSTTSTSSAPTTSSPTGSSPTTRSTASAARTSATSSSSRTRSPTHT